MFKKILIITTISFWAFIIFVLITACTPSNLQEAETIVEDLEKIEEDFENDAGENLPKSNKK